MRSSVLIAGPDLSELFSLSLQLGRTVTPTILETPRPVRELVRHPAHVDAAVVYLDGSENVADLRALLESHAGTRFVLLAPSVPPHAAVARIVAEHAGVVLWRQESGLMITATVVSLLTQAREESVR